MTELEFQLRASDLLETVKKIQRDSAALRVELEEFVTAFEAERADHERSIKHFEKAMNEDVR